MLDRALVGRRDRGIQQGQQHGPAHGRERDEHAVREIRRRIWESTSEPRYELVDDDPIGFLGDVARPSKRDVEVEPASILERQPGTEKSGATELVDRRIEIEIGAIRDGADLGVQDTKRLARELGEQRGSRRELPV